MIIFLDIDGVLNQLQKDYIDQYCVKNLCLLVRRLNARIVLSSTWRFGFTHNITYCSPQVQLLRSSLRKYGVDIYSRTGIRLQNRTMEIDSYLMQDNDRYVVLDDDKSLFTSRQNLYLVNPHTGLTEKDVKKILRGRF